MSDKVIRFGEFQIDRGRFQLFCQELPVRVEGRPMQLLLLLVEKAGELVTREQIADCLWGRDVFVDVEQGINTAIRKVRRALNDCADEPRYLQTVVGRGYRFIGEPVYDDDADTANVKMFTAEELGQAVLSAAGLDPSEYIASTKMRGD
jgi:DNA-binding winged helix-turn-helix (wHTH) protein